MHKFVMISLGSCLVDEKNPELLASNTWSSPGWPKSSPPNGIIGDFTTETIFISGLLYSGKKPCLSRRLSLSFFHS